jgi:1,4-alpha-glucan branching enzyme
MHAQLTDYDLHLFRQGNHCRLYEKLGAHPDLRDGKEGAWFAVWAPNAERVSVVGGFNDWRPGVHPLQKRGDSGIWESFVPGAHRHALYKYHIVANGGTFEAYKADPFAFFTENAGTASIVWDLGYHWGDDQWMAKRQTWNALDRPISVYEVHVGSWRRICEEGNRPLSYSEMASQLADYARQTGFTHVEFMPLAEHPFYGSWGYQATGFFAPTSRYGTPQECMQVVECLHRRGVGVFLDWVPSHFANDPHGLGNFDGSHLYESADPQKRIQPEWNSYAFDYARPEVRSFLLSSAEFCLDKYHLDGLRVDGVASMLYLDYGRKSGEWTPNAQGGPENLDAWHFCRVSMKPCTVTTPTCRPLRRSPQPGRWFPVPSIWEGWDSDSSGTWAGCTTRSSKDPIERKYHHKNLTFRQIYAYNENYVLPLSHDEVKPGMGSLIAKMPGDEWQKFANLRLLLGYMYAQAGKKLLFMGGEFGHWAEWHHERGLDWEQADAGMHGGVRRLTGTLNWLYKTEPALHQLDCERGGFEWVDHSDVDRSVIAFLRKGRSPEDVILIVCNFTSVPRQNYRVGVPHAGYWKEIFNSDAAMYGGAGYGNLGGVEATPLPHHHRPHSVNLTLPPLGVVYFKG